MQGTRDLTTGPILSQLFRLAAPIMATSFVQMAYTLTDMAWVGRLGSEAVAAIGAVGILGWMTTSLSLLNKVGAEISVAHAIGRKDEAATLSYASHNITLSIITGILWSLTLYLFARPIIGFFGLEPHITAQAIDYLRIMVFGLPFYVASAAFTGLFNASGRSRAPFLINSVGLVLNMGLDPLFIFGFKLGTNGAAIATMTGQIIVCLLFVYLLKGRKILLPDLRFFTRLQVKETLRILRLGTPPAALNIFFAFINFYICKVAASAGGHIGMLALTAGGQIEAITWNTAQGFSTALSTFVAQNHAARETQRIMRSYRTTLWLTGGLGGLCTLLFVFAGRQVFSLFVPEAEAATVGGDFMRIDGYSMLFIMLEITTQGMFYGIGRTLPPALISIGGNVLRIPIAFYVVSAGLGLNGIWWAISLSSILKGICAFIWFNRIKSRVLTA